jgi:prophage regulatory protein
MTYTFKPGTKVLRKPEVKATTGLSGSSIDRMVKAGDFPKPIPLGARAIGWPDFVVYDWLNEQAKSGETSA